MRRTCTDDGVPLSPHNESDALIPRFMVPAHLWVTDIRHLEETNYDVLVIPAALSLPINQIPAAGVHVVVFSPALSENDAVVRYVAVHMLCTLSISKWRT